MKTSFFTSEEFAHMSKRLQETSAGRAIYWRLLANAEWLMRQAIPSCPPNGPAETQTATPAPFESTTYRADYLLVHESFDIYTPAFEGAILTLGVAYRLTGDVRYWERLEKWVDVYLNEWDMWGPQAHPCDQFAVRIMVGMVYYVVLADKAPTFEVRKTVEYWYELAIRLMGGREALKTDQVGFIGNHSWFNMSMLGITALFLGDIDMADLFCDRVCHLTEWALGEDGDYLDKPNYVQYALRYALPFFYFYKRSRAVPPVNWEKVRRALWYAIDVRPTCSWVAPLLRVASQTKDTGLAYMAARLEPPNTSLLDKGYFFLSDTPLACFFYDPDVVPEPPCRTPAPRHYRATGYAVCGPLTAGPEAKLVFYAGPHSGKSEFDQGLVHLYFLGEALLSEPLTLNSTYLTAHQRVGHYSSNRSDLVAYIDDMGQCAGRYPFEWPDNRYTGHEVHPPIGRILSAEMRDGVFCATADLTRAYAALSYDFSFWGHPTTPPPELEAKRNAACRVRRYLRHVTLTPDNVLTVRDEIAFVEGKSFPVDIFFCSNGEVELLSPTSIHARVGRAAYEMDVTASQPFALSVDTYFLTERGKRLSVHFDAGANEVTCTCRFRLHHYKETV